MPVSYELTQKWEAWKRLSCKGSEMESAALFIVASHFRINRGTILLTIGNQERALQGLSNDIVHDTDATIKIAIESLKLLIQEDKITK